MLQELWWEDHRGANFLIGES